MIDESITAKYIDIEVSFIFQHVALFFWDLYFTTNVCYLLEKMAGELGKFFANNIGFDFKIAFL